MLRISLISPSDLPRVARAAEEILHRVGQGSREIRLHHRFAGSWVSWRRASRPRWPNRLLVSVREDAAHGVVALQARLELLLLGPYLAHHVFDDALVFAAQFGQFAELLAQAVEPRFEQAAHAQADFAEFAFGVVAHDVLLGGNQFPGQGPPRGSGRRLRSSRASVAVDFGDQALLRRNREDLALRQVQYRRAGIDLAIYFGIDFRQRLQFIPHDRRSC